MQQGTTATHRLAGLFGSGAPSRPALLALLAGGLLLVLLVRFGAGLYEGMTTGLDENIELTELKYEKALRAAHASGDFEAASAELARFAESIKQARLFEEDSLSLAEVAFQNAVNELAKRHALDIRSLKAAQPSPQRPLTRLSLSLNARGEIGGIVNFLIDAQNAEKLLAIDELEIKRVALRELRYYYLNIKLSGLTSLPLAASR